MNVEDVELCRVYGQMSREYYGDLPWDACLPRLQDGWIRVRRDPTLDWHEVEPLIRAFWEGPE
ncbi:MULTISPECIES: hypothetical protein [Luteimonas]|uniref:hypothetical protein n=1 Tax=Luteimonas TaxID=83614 RepID=UPI000C79FED8|nr:MULTISPECIES: hypothetical protein [Luteimonas]